MKKSLLILPAMLLSATVFAGGSAEIRCGNGEFVYDVQVDEGDTCFVLQSLFEDGAGTPVSVEFEATGDETRSVPLTSSNNFLRVSGYCMVGGIRSFDDSTLLTTDGCGAFPPEPTPAPTPAPTPVPGPSGGSAEIQCGEGEFVYEVRIADGESCTVTESLFADGAGTPVSVDFEVTGNQTRTVPLTSANNLLRVSGFCEIGFDEFEAALLRTFDGCGAFPTPEPSATPTATPTPTPTPIALSIPGRIEAEDYDGFFDTTDGNTGGQYRNDDVDIQVTSDVGGGFNVGWIAEGEYLTYPVNVEQDGQYTITLRVASRVAGGNILVSLNDIPLTERPLSFEATGGWQSWRDLAFDATLNSGANVLRLDFVSSSFNVNYIDFEWIDTPPPTAECQLPYFIDTLNRCMTPSADAIIYCEFPFEPRSQRLSGQPQRDYFCTSFRNPRFTPEEVTALDCPSPYAFNADGKCTLIDPESDVECRYPQRAVDVGANRPTSGV